MTILVTGCAGFIGSHVCERLLARGDKVIGIDDLNDYYDPDFKISNMKGFQGNSGFTFVKGDIRDLALLRDLFSSHDVKKVIHLAARAGVRPSLADPLLYQDVNLRGTLNLLECAREFSVDNFVFASSSSVYGRRDVSKASEDEKVDKQLSPYAAMKKAGEVLCYTYHHLYSLDVTCLRFFTVYGPRGRPDMAPYLFTKAISDGTVITRFGDGTSRRDYTFVSDIVSGVVAAVDRKLGYEIINLGNSDTVQLNDFISVIEKLVGKKAKIIEKPMPAGDVDVTYADISKAKKLLGYNPSTSVADGMREFYEWYKKERA
ncbi:epimerase [Candidatus Woesearchaeota archaeon CG11_big_fil_rev_8_21_14_0_20_43_8]|nr:MAG: epimerase [Candidatus Woesearchaeota archaeon CG11_big_fil_rev_8_21_14_0_20_43_8]PIO06379.1 MAG: epimerase [Candidatus Woesearchaeota archaeon CG08_land_8_20_14_0_20_43_7]